MFDVASAGIDIPYVAGIVVYPCIPFIVSGDVTVFNIQAGEPAQLSRNGINGVILITTKRGKSGEARVTFDAKWGVNKRGVPNYETITDPATFYELNYSSIYNADLKGYAAAGDLAKANAYANHEPICVAKRILCASPPDNPPALRDNVKYPNPTSFKKPKRSLISFKTRLPTPSM